MLVLLEYKKAINLTFLKKAVIRFTCSTLVITVEQIKSLFFLNYVEAYPV